jgi:hypothetical protein
MGLVGMGGGGDGAKGKKWRLREPLGIPTATQVAYKIAK